jgi:CHAT domain-containing protein
MPALPAARNEVAEIASIMHDGTHIFVDAMATEAEFKRQPLNNFKIIHFATHAFADPLYPGRSAIVLSPDDQTGNDGLLQIREIRNLYLRADLVTLSACDAGIGRVQGIEGMESLVSAFHFAGARSVLASRWATNDVFASSLMAEVYRNLANRFPLAEALREAQLSGLKKFGLMAQPFYWSAFFVSGDGEIKFNDQLLESSSR